MKPKKIILLSVLLVIISGGLYGYTEFNRKHTDLSKISPAISMDPRSLIRAYELNATDFDKKYTGKVIAVTGNVKKIDAEENPVVISLGEVEGLSTVQCSMDSTYSGLYASIKEGQQVTLKGLCTGGRFQELFGTDIILNRCVLVKN